MCGIAGYAGKNINPSSLREALDTIFHRGPDDSGLETYSDIGLGHQRLSILDLSQAGHQPMFSQDKDIVLVFNGEIYNFQDIKKQLLGKYKFSSQTDSEVIIYAYKEWGTDCLQHFNGMFSFVLYDRTKNLLFGARDRLGEKPLKYYWDGKSFFFASEVKAILSFLKSTGYKVDPDPYAIDDFLTFGYVPAPKTGFKNIYKLPPAHFFIFKENELSIKRYWSIDYTQKLDLSFEEWQEEILKRLEDSVKMRLMSDVPLGAFLSGGVDSSAVVAYVAKNSSNKLKTFSMGFDDPNFDETKYAQIVAEKYDTDHHIFRVSSKDLIDNLDLVSSFYDEPFADDSNLPTFLLAQKTKEHVTVVLNGDGGDESFGGYARYAVVEFLDFYSKIPSFIRNIPLKNLVKLFHALKGDTLSTRLNTFVQNFDLPFPRKYVDYNSIFSHESKESIYSKDFLNIVQKNDSFSLYDQIYNPNMTNIDNSLLMDIQTYLPEDLLYKTDIASMANGLEFRSPFLDHTFMEFTAKMPSNLKVSRGVTKRILKDALVKEDILPKEVVYRAKKGFSVPLNAWFKQDLKDYVYSSVFSDKMLTSSIFTEDSLKNYVDYYYKTKVNNGKSIYSLITLNNWLKKYF